MNFSKFKNKHFLALVGNLVISGFSVLSISLLYRVFTKSDIGTWFFFLTFLGLSESVRSGFLSTATVKFYSGTTPERGREVLGSIWYLALVLTGSICLIDVLFFLGIGFVKNEQLVLVIKWFGITLFSSLFYQVAYWILIAEEDYIKILKLRLINSGSMISIVIILAVLKIATLNNLLLVNLLTNCLTSIMAFILGYNKIKSLSKRSKKCIKEVSDFGKFSLGSGISSYLLASINTFVINFMLGPSVLAVYNLPQRLMEIVEIPLRSFVGTGMSTMAIARNNGDMFYLKFVSKKYAGILTFAFIPIIIFAFLSADIAVVLFGGSKYAGTEAANIFRLFILFSVFYPIDRFNGVSLDILNQQKINFYKVLLMIVANIVIAFTGVLIFHNIWGVAIASPFTLLVGLLFGYRHLRKHMDYTFSQIILIGYAESLKIVRKTFSKLKI